jgi:hypothetical protein
MTEYADCGSREPKQEDSPTLPERPSRHQPKDQHDRADDGAVEYEHSA